MDFKDFDGFLHVVPDRGVLIGQREKLGLSQEEVAARAGIKLAQYQMYENHEGRFSSSSMRIVNAVLTALELDPTAFANGDYSLVPVSESDPLNRLYNKLRIRGVWLCLNKLSGKKRIFLLMPVKN